jgi:hypothetical protein
MGNSMLLVRSLEYSGAQQLCIAKSKGALNAVKQRIRRGFYCCGARSLACGVLQMGAFVQEIVE